MYTVNSELPFFTIQYTLLEPVSFEVSSDSLFFCLLAAENKFFIDSKLFLEYFACIQISYSITVLLRTCQISVYTLTIDISLIIYLLEITDHYQYIISKHATEYCSVAI